MSKTCIKCGKQEHTVKGLCNKCYNRQWRKNNPEKCRAYDIKGNRKKGHLPMSENKTCASYLGIYVAERVLSKVFKNVEKQPVGNPVFDFICNKGMKIDVKSACLYYGKGKTPRWCFRVFRNQIADYFLCLAFDNRKDLNPLHMWLLPTNRFNHLFSTGISLSNITKWNEYSLDVDKVTTCCDVIKSDQYQPVANTASGEHKL